jgi:hypothetical protein
LAEQGHVAGQATGAVAALIQSTKDAVLIDRAVETLKHIEASNAYPAADVRKIVELARLRPSGAVAARASDDGVLTLRAELSANGANWIRVEPEENRATGD